MKFTESQLEQAVIDLLQEQGYPHVLGGDLVREPDEVLLQEDLFEFLSNQYQEEEITTSEIEGIVNELNRLPATDLYESNKRIMNLIRDGQVLKREDRSKKDLFVQLIDFDQPERNIYKMVNFYVIKLPSF